MGFLLWWIGFIFKIIIGIILLLTIVLFFVSLGFSLYQAIVHNQSFLKIFCEDFKRRVEKMLNIIF